jgi:predicted transcriptional regulator
MNLPATHFPTVVGSGRSFEPVGYLQIRVMRFIWKTGRDVSVHEVHDALNAEPGAKKLAYTTVLTVMRNLVRRHYLSQKATARSHAFGATISKREYARELIVWFGEQIEGVDVGAVAEVVDRVA